jgi:HD-GYP domain-containing protein (c-di-GMP phosphodiesterase class II)
MNILLFHPHRDTLEMMSFCLEAQTGLTVVRASTFQEAMDYFLEDTAIDLVVTSQQPETDKIFKYLLSTGAGVPVILIKEGAADELEPYPGIKVLGQVQRSDIPDELIALVRKNFDEILKSSGEEEYCRIKTELLIRVVPLRGDIYIRLSAVKFVKLFKTGMTFTAEDMQRFLIKKKVAFLYIKKSESDEFVDKFKRELMSLVAQATPGDENLFNTVGEVQDLVQDLVAKLGFTKEVQELAQNNMQLALKAIGNSPKLSKVLASSQLRDKNFISSHSVILAHISCSIAAQMQWPSNTTFQKLVMAALFHDFFFQDPEWAKISTKKELEGLKLKPTDEKYLTIKNHPIRCADLVKTFNEVPGDVDMIVLQHHERPDGTGFPKGLRSHQIAPLAAVMIVAHDILDAMTKSSDALEKFDLKIFLKKTEPYYQGSVFRKVWKALNSPEATTPPATSDSGSPAA